LALQSKLSASYKLSKVFQASSIWYGCIQLLKPS
jgi:hypothetical protein